MLFSKRLVTLLAYTTTTTIASPQPTAPPPPLVTLDYITLLGATSPTYNLTYYRRIPFGAPTGGENRFRAPQPPLAISNGTVYATDRGFDMCPQRGVNGSEDCLYLGVYSRPWARGQALRPVLLTFYGGGFVRGSAEFTIPPPGFPVLNASQENDYVVVYANYRTNVFGFLPGGKMGGRGDVDLNPGLLDQRAALEWIQKHIHAFGGDGGEVTIWGQSAGGGSVVAQAIATGNRGRKLFRRAMASSPFWPKTPRYDSEDSEAVFRRVASDVGCADAADQVACLKRADVQALGASALAITASRQYATSSFTWGPVVDDAFLARPLSEVVRSGGPLNAPSVLASYNLHEGENFVPPGFRGAGTSSSSSSSSSSEGFNASAASFHLWLQGFLPDLTPTDLARAKALYPPAGAAEGIAYNTTYVRAGLLYRDLVLACPALWLSKTARKGWLIEYTISPAEHASDTIYWNQINAVQKADPLTYQAYAGAMASFVQTGDPNEHKVTGASVPGLPGVEKGMQFLVTARGLGQGSIARLEERCAFWMEVSGRVPV